MRKHFLILMLMALLPLAGWAVERITVTLGTINKVYGEADPAVTELDFSWTTDGGPSTTEVNAANLLAALDYRRVSAGDEVNSVKYYTMVANSNKPADWVLVIANQGVINIMPKSLGTGTTALVTGISIADITGISYTGQAQTPDLSVHYTGAIVDEDLVKGTDYTVTWSENTNAGTATATLTGKGNYEGSVVKEFTIAARSLANVTIADIAPVTFAFAAGNVPAAQTPAITVTDAELGTTLVAGTDYAMVTDAEYTNGYKDNYNAGTGLVRIEGKGNYDNTTTANASFTINPLSIVKEDGSLAEGFSLGSTASLNGLVYTGEALRPGVAFRYNGTNTNINGSNRTVTYANNINATTAESKASITWEGIGNLTGSYTVTFDIAQRPVADLTFDASLTAAQEYTGSQITKNTTGMVTYGTLPALVAGTDFDVVNGDNLNVGDDAGSTEFTFKGNYTGTVTKNFNITRPTLTVAAKNFTKSLGNADPTSAQLATGNYYEITGFVGEENATTAGVTGTPGFAIEAHTETAGTKAGVISISDITGLTAANYFFAASATNADLIISSAGVAIAATNATQTYGYKLPTLDKDAFGFTATGLLSGENITALTFTVKDANNNEYAAGDRLEVGEYTITPSAASATSDSYEFSYTPATLTINPYKLQIVAQDLTIDYGSEPNLASTTNTYVKMYNVNAEPKTLITQTAFQDLYGVWKPDFIDSREWVVADNHPVAEPGTIKVNLKAGYDSKNFTVTTVDGTVTYNATSVPTDLAMKSIYEDAADDEFTKISTYHGQNMNVTITVNRTRTLESGKKYTWNGEDWNAFILPFDITPKELSEAFGYAIVNVVNPAATSGNNVAFKLQMSGTIPANTPFMLKNYMPVNGEEGTTDKVVNFGPREIKAPTSAEVSIDAGADIKFIGRYTQDVIDNSKTNAYYYTGGAAGWKNLKSTSTNTWIVAPFSAYMLMPTTNYAREITFTFEELDGSATVIKSVSEESTDTVLEGWYTINGIKLESAPTQKGIYIFNGKKVVIK